MLAVLRIRNLAIVEEVEIEFGPGLNVITGETGAGKSILLKAIELITGGRASADVLRSGAERCEIEALFVLNEHGAKQLAARQDELEGLSAGDELLLRRVIDKNGRSKMYINGSLTTAALLQSISVPLLDITGQHSQQTLLDAQEHRELLDTYGVPEDLRKEVREKYQTFAAARRALEEFRTSSSERAIYVERLRNELEELEEAALQPGERAEHEQELKKLANVESLGQLTAESLALLSEDEHSLDAIVRKTAAALEQAAGLDPDLREAQQLFDSAAVEIREVQLLLEEYQSGLEAEPERLEQLRDRIAEIARLERKYGRSLEELIAYTATIADELAEHDFSGLSVEQLEARLVETRAQLKAVEEKLTAKRSEAALRLAKEIENQLAHVNMKRARFKVELTSCESGPSGADSILFTLAANPGEPFRALQKVASGGELSRILLVLKTILTQQKSPATQIFDEIDSGIGGAVAQVVGEKLKMVANKSQVILITHAPQIAALADRHFLISKSSSAKRTRSTVIPLEKEEERVQQLAAMLAGKEVTSEFEASAKKLLRQGDNSGNKPQKKQVNA